MIEARRSTYSLSSHHDLWQGQSLAGTRFEKELLNSGYAWLTASFKTWPNSSLELS